MTVCEICPTEKIDVMGKPGLENRGEHITFLNEFLLAADPNHAYT